MGMSRQVKFTLSSEQLAEVEQAINYSPNPEVRQRAIAIRLLHMGHKPEVVGEMVAITANTIWTWHRRYRKEGISGLQDKPKSGRRRKADAAYIERLEQLLETDPMTLDLPFTVWTVERLRLYLEEQTEITLSSARFRALLQKLGYRWKQPKHDLSALQDHDAQAVMKTVLDWLKKPSPSIPSPKPSFSLWTKQP